MKNIIISFVIFGICVGIFLSLNPREYANFAESNTKNIVILSESEESKKNPFVILSEAKYLKNNNRDSSVASLPQNDNLRLDSSLRLRSAQNDNLKLDSATMPQDEFAYLENIFPSAHSSSLTDLGDRLLITYFAGSKEGASDVKIMAHFVDKSTLHSTPPREILSAQTLSILSGKFIKKLGNPLVFKSADGALHFFVVGVSLGGWATSKIYHLQISDDLETIKLQKELRLGLLGNFSHLVRTPPLMLENGGFMLPLYHELARKYPLVAFFDENGEFSHALRLNYLKNQLQPTIIALNKSECLAFFRNHKAYQNASFLQKCERGGAIWEAPNTTNLKAWDDSSLLLHYKNAENKSRILLLYNDGKVAESSNSRRSLGLYYLVDSANFTLSTHETNSSIADEFLGLCKASDKNRTLSPLRKRADALPKKSLRDAEFVFLQNIDIVDEAYPNEVSYPSAVIDENALFVGYTYNRKGIKLQKIKLAEIEKKIAESTLFGRLESNGLGRVSSFCFHKKKQKLLKSSCEVGDIKGVSYKSFLDSTDSQNLGDNGRKVAESALDSALSKHDANSSIADEFLGFCEASDADKTNGLSRKRAEAIPKKSLRDAEFANIFGIYLLFLSAFLFLTKSLSKHIKYLALPCFVAFISIPFIFVLWDYYSIVTLFYSLFGGASLFCALLCARYILVEILPRRFCESQNLVIFFEILRFAQNAKCEGDSAIHKCFAQNDKCKGDSALHKCFAQNDKREGDSALHKCFAQNDKREGDSAHSRNFAFTLALFSIPLFLGHLGLVNFDILRNEIASAIFVSAFIVALFWVDKWAFIFALIALILTKSLFGLFDGYLLIFSVVYCAIWAVKWSFKKIIAQA